MLAKCVRVTLQADARAAPHTTACIAPRQGRHARKANEEHIAHQDRVKAQTETHTVPKPRCARWVLRRSKRQTETLVPSFGDQFPDADFRPPVLTPIRALQARAVSQISTHSVAGQQLLAGGKSVAHAISPQPSRGHPRRDVNMFDNHGQPLCPRGTCTTRAVFRRSVS